MVEEIHELKKIIYLIHEYYETLIDEELETFSNPLRHQLFKDKLKDLIERENKVLNNILEHDPLRIIIVAAHRPSVFSMCHRVYKISNGSIHEANQEEVTRFLKGDD